MSLDQLAQNVAGGDVALLNVRGDFRRRVESELGKLRALVPERCR